MRKVEGEFGGANFRQDCQKYTRGHSAPIVAITAAASRKCRLALLMYSIMGLLLCCPGGEQEEEQEEKLGEKEQNNIWCGKEQVVSGVRGRRR